MAGGETLAEGLEPISANGWPPAEVGRLGDWRLHADRGYSGRANACWPIGAPGLALGEAIGAVERWYAARGLPAVFRPADIAATVVLREALQGLDYQARKPTLVMVGALPAAQTAETVALSTDPDPAFRALFLASADDPGDAAERIAAVARIAPPRAFARIERDGEPAAVGAAAVEAGWAGLFAMRTAPAHRRQGLARAIVLALSAYAAQAGARQAYLQVEAANTPAVALYEGLGFKPAYGYRYWEKPA